MSTKVNDFRDRFERAGGASRFSWAHFPAGLGGSE
jgi:hypothetical protein